MTAYGYGRLVGIKITVNMLKKRSNGTIYGKGQIILLSEDSYMQLYQKLLELESKQDTAIGTLLDGEFHDTDQE